MLSAKLSHVLWPDEHLTGPHIFLEVVEPKTRARGPRHQHVKIDNPVVVRFFERARHRWDHVKPIWPGTTRAFLKRFQLLVASTCGSPRILLPSSLRPGGATNVFEDTNEDLMRTLWRGRWQQPRMLGHYVQQLNCAKILQQLPPCFRRQLDSWSSIFEDVVDCCWR